MKLQDKVESFFSSAQIIQIYSEGDDTVMNVIFAPESFPIFSNMQNHADVREFFKGRKMIMVIDGNETARTFTLVDKKSGDALNIKDVKFISGNFEHFLSTVPKNRHIYIFFAGFSADGETKVFSPPDPGNSVVKIRGYVTKNIQLPE